MPGTSGAGPQPDGRHHQQPGCFDAIGALVAVATDTPRYDEDHDPVTLAHLGLLMEVVRTHAVRNSRFEGAAAGTPGTAPTCISGLNGSSLTSSIAGTWVSPISTSASRAPRAASPPQ